MESQLSKTYQKKTDIEHVRDNPDTYIGSVTTVTVSYTHLTLPTNYLTNVW